MLKTTLTVVSLGLLLGFGAHAQTPMTMTCSDGDMTKMQTQMNGMPAGAKKDMAMKEMGMAKDMMTQKKMDDCMMHMKKAQESM